MSAVATYQAHAAMQRQRHADMLQRARSSRGGARAYDLRMAGYARRSLRNLLASIREEHRRAAALDRLRAAVAAFDAAPYNPDLAAAQDRALADLHARAA